MALTRRIVLGAAPAALGAAAIAGAGSTMAQAPAASAVPGLYRYRVGDLEVTAFHEGTVARALDAAFVRNAPFPEVQAAMARAFLPTDTSTSPSPRCSSATAAAAS